MSSLTLRLALRYIVARRRAMSMSLLGIVLGIAFFVVTQAQTSGFEAFFIRTILGTNGAIHISDRFQDLTGMVSKAEKDGSVKFVFNSREDARYVEGVESPDLLREALEEFPQPTGISEILEGSAVIDSGSRKHSTEVHGIRIEDHILASNLENQIIRGKVSDFAVDESACLVGSRVADRLRLQLGDRVMVRSGTESRQFRIVGVFETGVSQIDKKRIFLHHSTTKTLFGRGLGRTIFQLSIKKPEGAVELAHQMQLTLGHRVISWQEREKVWLEVFRALRASSAITVSSILLLSGLGIFNVFAIMVIEKTRDIAILRSMGFTPREVSAVFLWQGGIVLSAGIVLGCLTGFLATYGISKIPMRIRGIFSTDSFVVNWDGTHYLWAILIASLFVSIASWIPARRAARIEPAKIIRETI